MSTTDRIEKRIEKRIELRAPLERVWRAVADSQSFGAWFGMELDGPFVAGMSVTGRIRPTLVDPEIARLQEPHAGKSLMLEIVEIEPLRTFAFRWHPFAIDPAVDYRREPTTLVTFRFAATTVGTLLTLTESGFDALPPHRRQSAFQANDGGWSHQLRLIEKFLSRSGT